MEDGGRMEQIGQLAATIFGFGFAFFAIWFHYEDSNDKIINRNIECKLLEEMKEYKINKELKKCIEKINDDQYNKNSKHNYLSYYITFFIGQMFLAVTFLLYTFPNISINPFVEWCFFLIGTLLFIVSVIIAVCKCS